MGFFVIFVSLEVNPCRFILIWFFSFVINLLYIFLMSLYFAIKKLDYSFHLLQIASYWTQQSKHRFITYFIISNLGIYSIKFLAPLIRAYSLIILFIYSSWTRCLSHILSTGCLKKWYPLRYTRVGSLKYRGKYFDQYLFKMSWYNLWRSSSFMMGHAKFRFVLGSTTRKLLQVKFDLVESRKSPIFHLPKVTKVKQFFCVGLK